MADPEAITEFSNEPIEEVEEIMDFTDDPKT
jgi:hypothetical protein